MPELRGELHENLGASPWETAIAAEETSTGKRWFKKSAVVWREKWPGLAAALGFIPLSWRAVRHEAELPSIPLRLAIDLPGDRLNWGKSNWKLRTIRAEAHGTLRRGSMFMSVSTGAEFVELTMMRQNMEQQEAQELELGITVEIGEISLTLSQFLSLQKGSVLSFARPSAFPVVVRFAGAKIGSGDAEFLEDSVRIKLEKLHGEV